MRKFVMVFGGISAAAAIMLAAAFATVAWKRSALDKGGRDYSEAAVPAIVPQGSFTPDRLGSLTRSARYLAWVRIEKGRSAFQVLVMQRDGKWLVHGYRVERGQKLASE